jgi:hypothetical protein
MFIFAIHYKCISFKMKDGLRDLVALLSNFGLPADLAEPLAYVLNNF